MVGLHCEIVVFPDHTACTDPGNIVGGGGGGPGPSATSFLVINLNTFLLKKNTIILQDFREGPTFSGGGGGVSKVPFSGGGGVSKVDNKPCHSQEDQLSNIIWRDYSNVQARLIIGCSHLRQVPTSHELV